MTQAQLAETAHQAFETKTRDDGTKFTYLKDSAPQWLKDALPDIHGTDVMPNDWRYEKIAHIFECLSRYDPDQWEDALAEIADNLTDVYYGELTEWLNAAPIIRLDMVDEAQSEYGPCETYRAIQHAQWYELYGMASEALRAIDGEAE